MAFSAEVCEAAAGERRADLLADGDFATGCNYWASHAGMYMWRNWDGAQVEKDLAALKATGVDVMRVFPLWQDFQPLTTHLIVCDVWRGKVTGQTAEIPANDAVVFVVRR